ncbi:MAG TPA: ribokinase [Trebonia sp.]|nr:ribokinase [Trebonia sp.]
MVPEVRLTVLGSLNMDISVTVPELPGPGATVLGGGAAYAPGGKGANQAVAAARLGARVRMVGCVGDDDFGGRLRAALQDEGIDDGGVRTVPGSPTGLAMITVDESGENMITVAPGANREVGATEIAAVAAGASPAAGQVPADTSGTPAPREVLVISAEIPADAIKTALAVDGRILRILNLAPAPPSARELVAGADWLVVNESEAASVLGRPVDGLTAAVASAAELTELGACHVVVTAGAEGAAYCARPDGGGSTGDGGSSAGKAVAVPGFRIRAVDTVGAGDTFVGALAVALGAGTAPEEAVRAACAAGAAAASRPGTQSGMPGPAEILTATGFTWPLTSAPRSSSPR